MTDATMPAVTPQASSTALSFSLFTCATLAANRSLVRCHLLSLSARDPVPPDRFDLVDFLLGFRLGVRLGSELFCDACSCAVAEFSDRLRLSGMGMGLNGSFMFTFLLWVETKSQEDVAVPPAWGLWP